MVAAIAEQAAKGIHLQQACLLSTVLPELGERLARVAPEGLSRAFFNSTGAEAVESSVKLARHATGKSNIVVFQGSYHGRSLGTLSLTKSKNVCASFCCVVLNHPAHAVCGGADGAGYGPLMPGVAVAPYPYCLHCPGNASRLPNAGDMGACCGNPIEQLKLIFKQQSAPEDTAAILLVRGRRRAPLSPAYCSNESRAFQEPILGEGGYVVPPDFFFPELRKLCDDNGILLIADEVQSGFGRTGSWWAVDQLGGSPDILVTAKGLASGMPLSGILARPELMEKSPLNSMGGTYGGNVVAAAASLATYVPALR